MSDKPRLQFLTILTISASGESNMLNISHLIRGHPVEVKMLSSKWILKRSQISPPPTPKNVRLLNEATSFVYVMWHSFSNDL